MEPFELVPSEQGHLRLTLAPVLDLRVAAPLKAALEAALSKRQPLAIEASAVEFIATPCIQVLLAATAALSDAGVDYWFIAPSEEFVTAFSDLGLFATLLTWKIQEEAA